jgi:CRISPR/Cas system CMR subunit Cmr6 (Cas7 group RAMP superfamily)
LKELNLSGCLDLEYINLGGIQKKEEIINETKPKKSKKSKKKETINSKLNEIKIEKLMNHKLTINLSNTKINDETVSDLIKNNEKIQKLILKNCSNLINPMIHTNELEYLDLSFSKNLKFPKIGGDNLLVVNLNFTKIIDDCVHYILNNCKISKNNLLIYSCVHLENND